MEVADMVSDLFSGSKHVAEGGITAKERDVVRGMHCDAITAWSAFRSPWNGCDG